MAHTQEVECGKKNDLEGMAWHGKKNSRPKQGHDWVACDQR